MFKMCKHNVSSCFSMYHILFCLMFKKPDEWVIPLKDKSIKELQDKEVVFTATFSRADQKAKWCFKGEEIFKGKQYKIEVLEDESGELTIHQLTIKKPMYKNMGKYTVTINEVQTGSYLDVEGDYPLSVVCFGLVLFNLSQVRVY